MTAYFCEEFRLEDPAERESQLLKPPTVGALGPPSLFSFGGTPGVGRAQEPIRHGARFKPRPCDIRGQAGRQGEDGRGQRWHATSMDSRELPQVGIGDGCVLSTSLKRELRVEVKWPPW